MNKRIMELALQARCHPALLLEYFETVDALTDSEVEELRSLEKFAELLIRQCVFQIADVRIENEFEPIGDAVLAKALVNIWTHFGLTESEVPKKRTNRIVDKDSWGKNEKVYPKPTRTK